MRPKVIEIFQEKAFTLIVEQVTVWENQVQFQLKNGLLLGASL